MWLILLAGCDQVFGLTGRDDEPSDRDDGGMIIVDGADASSVCPVHSDPLGDDDDDSIPNQSDLCPVTFDRGNNEDGDCFADACDLCPHLRDDVSDVDLDGIGDACDFPGNTVDARIFEGFDNADELHLFNMEIDHSRAQLRNSTAGPSFGFSNQPLPPTFWIETRFEIPTSPAAWNFGLIFGAVMPGEKPMGWAVTISSFTASEMRARLHRISNGAFVAQSYERGFVATGSVRLGVRVEAGVISVITTVGQTTNTEAADTMPIGPQQPTYWGVTTNGGLGAFDYMTALHH